MKNWKITVLVGMFCFSIGSAVSAEQNPKPCAEDIATLCKGVQPGQGRLEQCLKEHSNELTPACKENIKIVEEKMQDFIHACKADKEKLCKDTEPGEGRIIQCLKQHDSELSPACKKIMEQAKGRK